MRFHRLVGHGVVHYAHAMSVLVQIRFCFKKKRRISSNEGWSNYAFYAASVPRWTVLACGSWLIFWDIHKSLDARWCTQAEVTPSHKPAAKALYVYEHAHIRAQHFRSHIRVVCASARACCSLNPFSRTHVVDRELTLLPP